MYLDAAGDPLIGAPMSALLGAQAARDPDRVALVLPDETLSRIDLERRTNQCARQLAALGIGRNDKVLFALPNGARFYEVIFGIWKLGATPVHVSNKLTPREFSEVAALAEPKLVIDGDFAGLDRSLDDSPLPYLVSDNWRIATSGGSTGRPKLIVDPTPALWSAPRRSTRRRPGATIVNPAPLYHAAPFGLMLSALFAGCKIVEMGRFDAERYLALVEEHKADWAYLVPTMMGRILNLPPEIRAQYDIGSLETLLHMAAACPDWVKRGWIDWLGPDAIWEVYGGTERLGSTIIGGTEWLAHPGSVGRPRPGMDMCIFDDDGNAVGPDVVGEIYFRQAEGPASTFQYVGADARLNGDWASFGDMGSIDADGFLYLADRRTDMIVSGGVNVFPAEIEGQIDGLAGVVDSVVVGVPDDDFGHLPHAFVHQDARGGWTEATMLAELRDRLAPFKRPRGISFTDEPIRDAAGKVRRSAWRDKAEASRREDVSPTA
jgi:bile acid-coenzyme A ligase